MKKVYLLIVAICCTTLVCAQYKVGDVYEKDGIKAVVFYVDKAKGEALAITVAENRDPNMLNEMQEEFKKMSKSAKKEYKQKMKDVEQSVKSHYDRLSSLTSAYGADNMKVIKEYCKKNNVDMNAYFPALVWAESLGEGWFVPGVYEASLIIKYISYGVGKHSYKGTNKKDIKKKYDALNTQLRSNVGYENLHLPARISTSSIGRNSSMGMSWNVYKSLELREEQSRIANFSFRSDCYYDIDAYRPMLGMGNWVSYCNIAVCVVPLAESNAQSNENTN